ncbi:YdcF family protein [Pelagimonas varians]|uniref:DUF218 domain-containing protein n=1 Tax=Pelagimonas varians TaxID=696760 RepID=A0A238JWA4_9RHOB|nr:YdcF family protein [Pelagimonas varians]PYG34431.1 DUF218 domain-containing protein [Pelagimonas varians]SMX34092.1 hypothetical protein PEV8663_00385 [Pelagimonas varians]
MGIIKLLLRLGLFGSGLFLATLTIVVVSSRANIWPSGTDLAPTDVIVCLGGGISYTTGKLQPMVTQRATTCARLYLSGKAKTIVFTGAGISENLPSAAALMARHAIDLGVPDTAIFVEPEARSTLQNALFSLPQIPEGSSVRVVTDSFHLPRSWISFYWAGYSDLTVFPSQHVKGRRKWGPNSKTILREAGAYWFNLARIPVYSMALFFHVPNAERVLD